MHRLIDYKHERNGESQIHHDKLYTGINLHAIYYVSCKQSAVEMCVRTSQSDSSPWVHIHTLHSTQRSQTKHQVDCNTIFRGRMCKLSSTFVQQNSVRVPDKRFEIEVPPPHKSRHGHSRVSDIATNIYIQCITSCAASPSCSRF